MNRKKITALLLSSVMALTPAMPAMAEQSTIVNYVDGTTDSTVETPDVTPTPLPEKKEGWETVDGVKYYYVNGEKITNKVKKIGKYTYCFDKTGKLVTNKPYYKVNAKTYYKIKNGASTLARNKNYYKPQKCGLFYVKFYLFLCCTELYFIFICDIMRYETQL